MIVRFDDKIIAYWQKVLAKQPPPLGRYVNDEWIPADSTGKRM